MIRLPKWVLTNPIPATHDLESVTAIQMVGKLYTTMNTLIDEYNKFVESTEQKIDEFMNDANADRETFKIAMRQEFQDFIDTVDLRLQTIENDTVIATQNLINNAIRNGSIKVQEEYDVNSESLNMNVTGGV